MIDEQAKIRNGLMERFYQAVSDHLAKTNHYIDACDVLVSLFETTNGKILSTSNDFIIQFEINEIKLVNIHLYNTDDGGFYLDVSPTNSSEKLETQIKQMRELLRTL